MKPDFYSYIVWLACFMVIFLTGGIGYGNVSVYHLYWMETFDASNTRIAMIGSLNIGLTSLMGPAASVMVNYVGHRMAIIIGGLVSTCGMLTAAFLPTPDGILISYGVLTGTFWCLAFIPGSMGATFYFPLKYHGIIIGVCSAGMGLGPFVAPVFVKWLEEHYSWRGALIIQAGINLNLVACGMTLIPKDTMRHSQDFFKFYILRNPYYINILLSSLFSSLGLSVIFVHIAYCVELMLHTDNFQTTLVVTMTGLGSFIGRIVQGMVASHPRINVIHQYIFSMAVMATATLSIPFVTSFRLMLAIAVLIGLGIGAFGTVPGILISRIFEPKLITSAFGYQQFTLGLGLVVGAPLAGNLYDITNDYALSMYVGAGMLYLAGLNKLIICRQWNRYMTKCMVEIDLLEPTENTVNGDEGKNEREVAEIQETTDSKVNEDETIEEVYELGFTKTFLNNSNKKKRNKKIRH